MRERHSDSSLLDPTLTDEAGSHLQEPTHMHSECQSHVQEDFVKSGHMKSHGEVSLENCNNFHMHCMNNKTTPCGGVCSRNQACLNRVQNGLPRSLASPFRLFPIQQLFQMIGCYAVPHGLQGSWLQRHPGATSTRQLHRTPRKDRAAKAVLRSILHYRACYSYGGLGPASAKLLRPEVQRDHDRCSSATMRNFSTPTKAPTDSSLCQAVACPHAWKITWGHTGNYTFCKDGGRQWHESL